MADNNLFKIQLITPSKILYNDEATMIELRTTEGEIGVYKNHIPLTAIIAPGILRIKKTGEEDKEAALLEGFIEILGDKVTILAESCEWPDEIDIERANEARIRAERRLSSKESDTNLLRAESALRRSLTRIEVANRHPRL